MSTNNADFTPELSGYSGQKPFRFWCQQTLPLVYDDSLSYYELLCKVVNYLNNVINDVSAVETNVSELNTAYIRLQNYVNNYFNSLDVTNEINNKLDRMSADGSLTNLIKKYVDPIYQNFEGVINETVDSQNTTINELVRRMDTFASLTEGSTTGDAELTDIRVPANGFNDDKNYATSGDAVRGQISTLSNDVDKYNSFNLIPRYAEYRNDTQSGVTFTWLNEEKCLLSGQSTALTYNRFVRKALNFESGKTYIVKFKRTNIYSRVAIYYYINDVLDTTATYITADTKLTLPANVTGVLFRIECTADKSFNNDSIEIKILNIESNEDIITELNKHIYSKDVTPFVHNNTVNLNDINVDGYYVLSTSYTILNAPNDIRCTAIKVENYSVGGHGNRFIQQTVEDIVNIGKIYTRASDASGVFSEWTLAGGNIYNNEYTIEHYDNTYNIECYPEITTDTNNFLASTGDTTNVTASIQTMLNNNGICRLGSGDFYVDGINIPSGASLIGSGNATRVILISGDNKYAVKLNNYGCVKNLRLMGQTSNLTVNETVRTRHGIIFEGLASTSGTVPYRSTIENVLIQNFAGGGITCYNTGYDTGCCLNVSNCNILRCDAGINISYWSEFHRFTNVNINLCYYGCVNNGGNNMFINCGFSSNTVGIYMDNANGQSINNSHGSYIGCVINHSGNNTGYAIKMNNMTNGVIFSGCQIFYGTVEIINCTGVRFIGLNTGRTTNYNISNSSAILFDNCLIRARNELTFNVTGSTGVNANNCYYLDGTVFNL